MSDGNLQQLVEIIRRKGPEYLDLLTSTSDAEFDEAFQAVLAKAVMHLEKNKKHFKGLDEEGLTAVLAAALTIPGLTVSQESHSNGHVDLTIVADHCTPVRTKLGEAKIYRSPSYHLSGLDQLLRRYTTGRETCGLLLSYVRVKNIKQIVSKLRQEMDATLPNQQTEPSSNCTLKWSFKTNHAHSSGENLDVSHISLNLHIE